MMANHPPLKDTLPELFCSCAESDPEESNWDGEICLLCRRYTNPPMILGQDAVRIIELLMDEMGILVIKAIADKVLQSRGSFKAGK